MTSMQVEKAPWIYRSVAGYRAIMDWYDRNLELLPVAWESKWVETTSGKSHVLALGEEDAPPIVILHGISINALAIRRFLLPFARSHRVYAPDIIGQAGKSAAVRHDRSGSGYPQWLVEVLDGLGLERVPVLGISFGGWLAMKLAGLAPERMSHGIFFVPAGLAPVQLGLRLHFLSQIPLYWIRPTPQRLHRILQPMCSPNVDPEPALAELMGLSFRYVKQKTTPFAPFSKEHFSKYSAPTLVMAGEKDLFYNSSQLTQHAKSVLPHAEVEVVANGGHILFDQQMEDVYQRMLTFLRGC